MPVLSPQFEIVPEEDPQNAIVASSALTCHSNLLKAIASVRYTVLHKGRDWLGWSRGCRPPTSPGLIQSRVTLMNSALHLAPSLWRPSCHQEPTSSASHTQPSRTSSRAAPGRASVASNPPLHVFRIFYLPHASSGTRCSPESSRVLVGLVTVGYALRCVDQLTGRLPTAYQRTTPRSTSRRTRDTWASTTA